MAVRIPGRDGGNQYMVEARLRSDQYDRPSFASAGVPSEGVIVYEVAGKTEVYLRTPNALGVGDTFTASGDDRLEVSVTGQLVNGFTVAVTIPLAADERTVPLVRFLAPGQNPESGYAHFLGTQLDADDAVVLVAERAGRTVGYVFAGIEPLSGKERRDEAGFVHDIVVDEADRRSGET